MASRISDMVSPQTALFAKRHILTAEARRCAIPAYPHAAFPLAAAWKSDVPAWKPQQQGGSQLVRRGILAAGWWKRSCYMAEAELQRGRSWMPHPCLP